MGHILKNYSHTLYQWRDYDGGPTRYASLEKNYTEFWDIGVIESAPSRSLH